MLVLLDVMATVLHPEVESPLSARFQRTTWWVLNRVQRLVGERNGVYVVLTWALPIMVTGLIGTWLLLLASGFAVIYFPWLANPAFFSSDTPVAPSFLNALYYSGVTLGTLGYGDILPVHGPFRLLAVLEAVAGATTISFAVAYVLAVYPALARTRTLATALDAEVAGQASALPMVRRYLVEEQWNEDLAARLRDLALELLALTDEHETHPVLYYAHPRRVQHSFLRVVVTVQGLVGSLRYTLSPDRHATIVRNPQLLLLEQSLHYSLRRLSASLHIPPVEQHPAQLARPHLAAVFSTLCDDLEHLGLVSARTVASNPVSVLVDTAVSPAAGSALPLTTPASDGAVTYDGEPDVLDPALDLRSESALESYITFRVATDPYIAVYASACGYAIEAARADYKTTWWVGGR